MVFGRRRHRLTRFVAHEKHGVVKKISHEKENQWQVV